MGELLDTMTSAELVEWMAYDMLTHAEQEKAVRQAQKGMRRR